MCDTMIVVGDDGVLFAKNSDRDGNEAQVPEWRPAADHGPGAEVECTWMTIDQVPHTHATLVSRPFWMWGAEIAANEHGVVIGNEAVFTDQAVPREGLTGMDLLRVAVERAATAEEAVETIVTLLEAHGQGGGCGHENRSFRYSSSFLVADPNHGIVLETAGRHWATEEVRTGARSISNGLTIAPFADAHGTAVKTHVSGCRRRRAITEAGAADAAAPGDLMAVLRDHGGPVAPRYSWLNGAMSAPCMHAGGLVVGSQTTASWVADLRPGHERHWLTATAAPCTGLFKPFTVDDPVELGPVPDDRADAGLWWRHERLHRAAMADPEVLFPLFTDERDTTEMTWLADPPPPAAAIATGDDLLDRWTRRVEAHTARDRRPGWARRYWARRSRAAGLDSFPTPSPRPL